MEKDLLIDGSFALIIPPPSPAARFIHGKAGIAVVKYPPRMKTKSRNIPHGDGLRRLLGQLVIVSISGDGWNAELETLIHTHKAGGFILFKENIPASLPALKAFTAKIKKETLKETGADPFISVDEEGGRVSRLKSLIGERPAPMSLAPKGLAAVYRNYLSLGKKVRSCGFNITWAPVLDVNTNPQNPVIGDRAFSANTEDVVDCGKMALRALRAAGLYTQAKHYPGHGDTPVDSHLDLPKMDTPLKILRRRELKPFAMAVREKADFFMTAHIHFTKVEKSLPATFSKKFLQKLLRDELGFKGLAVTDDLNMNAVKANYPMEDRIKLALNAGADVLLIRDTPAGIMEFLNIFEFLVSSGEIPWEAVRRSLARVRRVKRRF